MIGDVGKADTAFAKLLGDRSVEKKLVGRVTTAESQNWSGAPFVLRQVEEATKGIDWLRMLRKGDKIKYIVERLSTRPHTSSNSKFIPLVKNSVSDRSFLDIFGALSTGGLLNNDQVNLLYRVNVNLLDYLNRSGRETSKYKDAGEQMRSHRLSNRLKISVTGVISRLIYFALKLNEIRKADEKKRMTTFSADDIVERLKRGKYSVEDLMALWPDGAFLGYDHCARLRGEKAKLFKNVAEKCVNVMVAHGTRVLEEWMFCGFPNLRSVDLLGSVYTIKMGCFRGCENLVELSGTEGLQKIGPRAFEGCKSLVMDMPRSLKAIDNRAFCSCESLRSINIPGTVQTIGVCAFTGCASLESVTLDRGIREIGAEAFMRCAKLKKLYIPNSVESVGDHAFDKCPRNMEILGDPRPEIKEIIQKQIKGT